MICWRSRHEPAATIFGVGSGAPEVDWCLEEANLKSYRIFPAVPALSPTGSKLGGASCRSPPSMLVCCGTSNGSTRLFVRILPATAQRPDPSPLISALGGIVGVRKRLGHGGDASTQTRGVPWACEVSGGRSLRTNTRSHPPRPVRPSFERLFNVRCPTRHPCTRQLHPKQLARPSPSPGSDDWIERRIGIDQAVRIRWTGPMIEIERYVRSRHSMACSCGWAGPRDQNKKPTRHAPSVHRSTPNQSNSAAFCFYSFPSLVVCVCVWGTGGPSWRVSTPLSHPNPPQPLHGS